MTTELTPEFATSIRGYDRVQVDDYVDTLREWLDTATARMQTAEAETVQLREHVTQLRQRLTQLEFDAGQQPPRSLAAFGDRVQSMLVLAQEGAEAVKADAETVGAEVIAKAHRDAQELARATLARQAEIEAWVTQATRQAETMVGQAEQHATATATKLTADAEARAASREAQAEQRARELVEQAQAEAARLADVASNERAQALQDMAAHREELAGQIRALEAQRDEVLAALTSLRESLHRTIGQLPAHAPAARHFGPAGEDPANDQTGTAAPLSPEDKQDKQDKQDDHHEDPDNTVLFDQAEAGGSTTPTPARKDQ